MAKETATPAPAGTKAEKKPEKKAPAESVYTVSELAGNARSVFGTMQECVIAALKLTAKPSTQYRGKGNCKQVLTEGG